MSLAEQSLTRPKCAIAVEAIPARSKPNTGWKCLRLFQKGFWGEDLNSVKRMKCEQICIASDDVSGMTAYGEGEEFVIFRVPAG